MSRPRPSTEAHLDALTSTGADGYLVISHPTPDGWRARSFHVSEVDAAAQHARNLDDASLNVYLRSSLLRRPLRHDRERGTTADTGAAVALVVDLDIAGPGHNHKGELPLPPDLDAAMSIVAELPPPTLHIRTGGGVHLWWLLDEPEVDEPVELLDAWADRIVAAGAARGFHVDRPDPARVLRVPGTHRRKVDRSTGEKLCNLVTLDDEVGGPAQGLAQRPWTPTRRYGASDLLEVLPAPAPPPAPPAPKRPRQPGKVGPADAVSRLSWGDPRARRLRVRRHVVDERHACGVVAPGRCQFGLLDQVPPRRPGGGLVRRLRAPHRARPATEQVASVRRSAPRR